MLVKTKHGDILATLIYRLFHKKWSADCLDTACCCCLQSVPEFLHRKVTMEVLTLKRSMGSNIFRVSDSLTSTSASADASYITENSGLCQVLIWLAFIFSWVPAVYLFSPFRLLHFLENSTHLSHFCGELLWWKDPSPGIYLQMINKLLSRCFNQIVFFSLQIGLKFCFSPEIQ